MSGANRGKEPRRLGDSMQPGGQNNYVRTKRAQFRAEPRETCLSSQSTEKWLDAAGNAHTRRNWVRLCRKHKETASATARQEPGGHEFWPLAPRTPQPGPRRPTVPDTGRERLSRSPRNPRLRTEATKTYTDRFKVFLKQVIWGGGQLWMSVLIFCENSEKCCNMHTNIIHIY